MQSLWFVGILEYYAASLCLLKYQLLGSEDKACNCDNYSYQVKTFHKTHGTARINREEISPAELDLIGQISHADQTMYNVSREVFYYRMLDVEKRLNFRLLCGVKREELEQFVAEQYITGW